MAESSIDLFRQACGAAGPLRLAVAPPAGREESSRTLDQPFALVGREAWADVTLADAAVSRRHAYLQMIAGRVFYLDLGSRGGVLQEGRRRRSGWLEPDRPVTIGPFAVRLDGDPPAPPAPAADWDPRAWLPPDQDALPAVSLEVVSGDARGLVWRMNRVLALVGQASDCKVRVQDQGVGLYHCGLLRTPLGLWVIGLQGPGGTSVNRTPVRLARLAHGDELLVGDTLFGVRYDPAPGPVVPPAPNVEAAAPAGEPEPSEADRLRAELERAAAELALAREALDGVAGERAETEQRWCAESEAARAEAAALREELETGRAQAAAAARQGDELHEARAEAARIRQEAAAVREELEAARVEADAVREERDRNAGRAEAAGAETEGLRSRVAELEGLAVQACDALERAESEQQRWREELETARVGTTAEVDRLSAELAAVRTEAGELRDRSAELERLAAEERTRSDAEQGRYREEFDTSRAQAEGLRAELGRVLEAADAEATRLRREADAAGEAAREEADRLRAELAAARAEFDRERAEAEERTRSDAEQGRPREEFDAARAEAEGLRAELGRVREAADAEATRLRREADAAGEAAREEADRLRAELAAARAEFDRERAAGRAEADALRVERDRAAEQSQAAHVELRVTRTQWAAAAQRWHQEMDAARAAAGGADALQARVAELEAAVAEASKSREAQDRARWEEQVRWEAERQELTVRLQEEAQRHEADRRTAAESVAAARTEPDRQQTEALRAEVEAAGVRVRNLERAAAEAGGLRAELAAARGQLDDEKSARRAEADRLGRELETLRRDRDSLERRVESLAAELALPVVHGVNLGSPPRMAGAVPARAEQARADDVRADLQRQLAEASRQLQEARARADRLEAEARARQQSISFRVLNVPLPRNQGKSTDGEVPGG